MIYRMQIWRMALMWLLFVGVAAADPTPSEDERAAIRSIIEAQLDAFHRNDADAAFALASADIQKKFGDAQNFMYMVRAAYPVVYRPASVVFLQVEGGQSRFTQTVHLADGKGRPWLALYAVIRLPDGHWRINGCAIQALATTDT